MKVPVGLDVGVCSHTGLKRGGNEDDYLLAMSPRDQAALLVAIADGMGGVAGGAEASRTALRALGAKLLDGSKQPDAHQRMLDGFQSANARVLESADAVHALQDMGTTLTALWLDASGAVVGHIGDSRLYLVRDDGCQPLTVDHSVNQGESLLTRCIGGGQRDCVADSERFCVGSGDRYVLCTDGVWNVVEPEDFAKIVATQKAQAAAEMLVKRALDAGGPDNATVLVVDVIDASLGGGDSVAGDRHDESSGSVDAAPQNMGETVEVELPRHERPDARSLWPNPASLRPSVWSWLLLVGALALLVYSGLRWAGFDALPWSGE
jgi:PPM family protein phosphatase